MIAGIVFLTVFFTLGTVLLLMTHYALVTEQAQCLAKLESTPTVRDGATQGQPGGQSRDRAA
jgi:hypothetical protein